MKAFQADWNDGTRVRWRSLRWGEYEKVSRESVAEARALEIYKTCLLAGPIPEMVPAGVMLWIAQFELKRCVFHGQYSTIKTELDLGRQKLLSNWLIGARAMISALFRYSFEEIDSWDSETFMERVAQAEFVSGRQLEPTNPDEKPKQAPNKKDPRQKPRARLAYMPKQEDVDVEQFSFQR